MFVHNIDYCVCVSKTIVVLSFAFSGIKKSAICFGRIWNLLVCPYIKQNMFLKYCFSQCYIFINHSFFKFLVSKNLSVLFLVFLTVLIRKELFKSVTSLVYVFNSSFLQQQFFVKLVIRITYKNVVLTYGYFKISHSNWSTSDVRIFYFCVFICFFSKRLENFFLFK